MLDLVILPERLGHDTVGGLSQLWGPTYFTHGPRLSNPNQTKIQAIFLPEGHR